MTRNTLFGRLRHPNPLEEEDEAMSVGEKHRSFTGQRVETLENRNDSRVY
jgi:hypothetical protein